MVTGQTSLLIRPWASGKHVREIYTHLNPILYRKNGKCRDILIFLIFAPKHRLWVLVRSALELKG